ncbi:MAG: GNAT family N-acetyltransferase [Acidimicrobiia bacterium]
MHLRTERLNLRPFRPDDVAAFERFTQAEEYRRYLGDHPDPAAFVNNNVGADGAWVIELDQRVVGSVFLGTEIACLLDPSVHRMGIATEAAAAVIEDGFMRRGYDEIVARADVRNLASLRAMARLGFVACEDETYRLHRSVWQGRRDAHA